MFVEANNTLTVFGSIDIAGGTSGLGQAMRLNPNGTLDGSFPLGSGFGLNGLSTFGVSRAVRQGDGKTIVGLLLREEGAVYVVSDPTGKELRLAKADVDKKTTILQSAMPANVDTLVPEKDYYALLTYLLAPKPR